MTMLSREADMRSSVIAIMASAAIATAISVLTEPVVSAQGDLPKSTATGISKPAIKRDRFYFHPIESCLFAREKFSVRNNCLLRPVPVQPAQHPAHRQTVIVKLRSIELAPSFVVADGTTIG